MLDRNPLPCPPTHLHLHASRTTEHILAPPHIYTYVPALSPRHPPAPHPYLPPHAPPTTIRLCPLPTSEMDRGNRRFAAAAAAATLIVFTT